MKAIGGAWGVVILGLLAGPSHIAKNAHIGTVSHVLSCCGEPVSRRRRLTLFSALYGAKLYKSLKQIELQHLK